MKCLRNDLHSGSGPFGGVTQFETRQGTIQRVRQLQRARWRGGSSRWGRGRGSVHMDGECGYVCACLQVMSGIEDFHVQ